MRPLQNSRGREHVRMNFGFNKAPLYVANITQLEQGVHHLAMGHVFQIRQGCFDEYEAEKAPNLAEQAQNIRLEEAVQNAQKVCNE